MIPPTASPDSQVILMACSNLALPRGDAGRLSPLNAAEWNVLARQMKTAGLRAPGTLLQTDLRVLEDEIQVPRVLAERLRALFERAGPLAIELERLSSAGIWVMTQADDAYPSQLLRKLGDRAPMVLYGAGSPGLLTSEGLAVVGSRDVDEAGAAYAERLGSLCAEAGMSVVSGAAKGVDQKSMTGAIDRGGKAVGVLADSLEKMLTSRHTRRLVMDEQVTLVTMFHPRLPFSVHTAMQRNKLIYALSRFSLVVSTSLGSGGTWAGALENLRGRWVPLYVRQGPDVPEGNRELIRSGALTFPDTLPETGRELRQWLEENAADAPSTTGEATLPLEGTAGKTPLSSAEGPAAGANPDASDVFPLVWPRIAALLDEPRTDREVADHLCLEPRQAKIWLERAVRERLAGTSGRPRRFQLARTPDANEGAQRTLF